MSQQNSKSLQESAQMMSSQQIQSQQISQQRVSQRMEQHVTRQVTSQQTVQGGTVMIQGSAPQPVFGSNASPPIFEQIFRNARFAQGGDALFEGKVRGIPKPTVSWTRKGAPLTETNKYKMTYNELNGMVTLLIKNIGPGDEGEYTCTAKNQYGEAICSVFIQPESMPQLQQVHKEFAQSYESSEQRTGQQTQRFHQTSQKTMYSNGHMIEEDFKVDTFEYRLLREVSFRESITRRTTTETDIQMSTVVERSLGPPAPPQIAQKPRNSKLLEGSNAVFTAKVGANPKPRLTWFKNGQRIVHSEKYETAYSNNQATLNVRSARSEDSGHYTLLAENPQGCVVSSAYLAIEPVSTQEGLIHESTMKQTQVEVTETDAGKSLAPNFVRVCNDRDVTEGKMTRFDCRVTGRPYPEVTWFINGRQVSDDATHKILVNESGNHALMITNVNRMDSGSVACVARNKAGETSFQCALNVIEKEQVVAPKFVERFTTVNVKEGEPVVLHARAVGTPIPRITWQKDGVPIAPGPDVRISTDGGVSTMDISIAKASDAAWYQCTAQNVAGSTATRARLFVETPKGSAPEPRRLNLPRPSKVIEPEPAPGPEVIYLRHVERAKPHAPSAEEDRAYPPPQFIIPLQDMQQMEGGRVHFEARIEPVGDPTMKVEWFVNGRPLEASSRATVTFRFGFIALDLISIVMHDSGEYVCRVTTAMGCVESRALLSVTSRASIEQTSQHPDSLQYIQQLEDYSRYQRTESVEESSAQRPVFIRSLQDLGELQEGRNAHFEAQLTPVSDPTMKVEWYKDGRAITASSRITTIYNFGYVSLNIMHLRAEDAGTYTVRAVNRMGEAISSSTLKVYARTSVTGDLGIPEQQRYIEKVEELEAYQEALHRKYVEEQPECTHPPEFKTPIKDQQGVREGGFAHFEARLEPTGDSTLRVEWLKDGKPVEASSRITTFFNFGYVALTIKQVTIHDVGNYTCRAYNAMGQATTSAQLSVVSKKDIIFDSQHPGGLQKIQVLEDSSRFARQTQEEVTVTQKPRFLGPLKGTNKIVEGQRAHFEARVEPQSDLTMKIEWYHNGKVIQSANRIQSYYDFGYVALDIMSVRSEDAGQYTVVARNSLGEAQLCATMSVETRASIDTSSMHRSTYDKTQRIEESKFVEPQYHIEEISKSKPIFVQPLSDPKPINEGKSIHLECRLEPMGDPTMRVEWFCNGKPITVGSRFRTYYDFGFVALDIVQATALDSGEYTVRATNHLGSAHTSACVRVMSRSDILTESQNEQSLEQIQMLEDMSRYQRTATEDVTVMQAPQFTRPLHNIETIEGTNVHMECRLQPVGDPSMRVEWFVNGVPVKTGHRFRPAHEFDYVALDLLSVYPVDSGVYTCQARNQLGEAVTSCSVRVIAKKDLLLESQHPSGLEKIQYLEDSSRYKRTEYMDEVVNIKPRFLTKPKSMEKMREGQHAHFECKLEPVTDPNLKVEWYKNGRPITVGHRFRPIHDFGYVALDITDLIAEDSGTYTCRAVNLVGVDETNCSLNCVSTAQILTGTQNETGLEQIQHLEDRSRYHRSEYIDEMTTQAPIFTTSLKNIEIKESQRAHFECRLIPVSDPTMRVEWYHNNQPVKSGSRFTETNNFGFVALDILYCYPEDSGTYTCRALNALGESVTSATCNVHSKKSIYLETQHEEALTRLRYLEDSSRYQRQEITDETITQAPVFTLPVRDLRVAENQAAHFEARLIPVGDSRMKVEWFRNGVAIEASNRITTMHDFGYVALNMKYVNPEDAGTYTCRAVNELGEASTSATLFVHTKSSLLFESQHEGALQKIQHLEDATKYHRREEEEVIVTQAPKFTAQLNGPTNLHEAQSAHYECRIEPYPDANLKVEWFCNGKPLQTGHRFRTAYDFGFASLDILTVYEEDSGEYTCKATNLLGQAQSSIKLNVKSKSSIIRETQHEAALQKIQHLECDSRHRRAAQEETVVAEKPQFGRPLKSIENLPEGKSAHLEATLTPVNDPTMKVEWYCNGRPIQQGHRFKTTYDFGFVALDILYAYAEDSGTYMCKARNAVGEAVTTAAVTVVAKSGLQLDTMDEQRLKKIRDLESYERPQKHEAEPEAQRPVFLTPLVSLEKLKEGDHAHLECRVEPINDPNLKIEWFINGVAIRAGHRFRTTHDFGYVALDVLYTYPEDTGTYMCKATNLVGEAVNTCTIKVAGRRSIILETHHPDGLEKIRELEAQGHPARLEVEEPVPTAPRFITELRGTTEVHEGKTAHFEAQVEPIHDSNLRIEFYHNGKPLPSAARFHITFDFGYLALDISHCVPEDAGEYTVKAVNSLGQCTSSISMRVIAKDSIIIESQRPEGLEKIKQLEEQTPYKRPEFQEAFTRQCPVFTQPLQNIDSISEGQTAHFECRLIPVGDPMLKVEWFRNEKPLEDSSRINKVHDFGFVSLDITHIREEDEGVYMCRASNPLGEAVTTASMKIRTKASIQLETQHPEGMRRIQQLEQPHDQRREETERVFEKPIFTQILTGPAELWEGQNAHFEARVVPVGDPTLKFEWYVNGVELKLGSRFRVTHDFGYVTLDITSTVQEDSGVYMCKAINQAGEAVSSTTMKVKSRSGIVKEPIQPDAWQKIQLKEAEMNRVPEMFVDTTPQQAPVFTTHLQSYDKLVEGQHVYLEAQVEPRADPNLRVEWYKNGISLTTGTRIRSTFDFGLVSLSINSLREDDSAIYTCKATNLLGEAVSTCTLKIEDRHWLLGQTLHPGALPLIDALEQPTSARPDAPEPTYEIPVFITHLNNIECTEGENVHFECRVEPSKDATLKIEWFINGKPLPSAARYKSTYDFGYVSLDVSHTYEEDSGIYTCKATNSKGSASTTGTLRCTSKDNILLGTQHPQGRAGLEAVQEVEEAYAGKLQRQASGPEAEYPKPIWTTPLNPEFKLGESEPLHLEGTVEPKEDPNLKIEWFLNGKSLEHGSRFKMTNDFGFVTLDLTDVYERDQGIYTCKASNRAGEAFTSTTIYCSSKANLIERTQHPKGKEGLEKIQDLEDALNRQEAPLAEGEEGHAPEFTSQFTNLTNLSEGEIAHFEAGLIPTGDQSMVVEWFYNGEVIKASHRIRTVHAFGMVVLEILGTKIEDSGTYTCRATNKWGKSEISVHLECVDKSKGQKPHFTTQIQSITGLKDGQSAHFECTLEPVGDPHMKVEWFHNGRPLLQSSRIKSVSDFGFVVLDISYIQDQDSGEYVCKASNKYGEDYTKATISAYGKGGVFGDSLQPDSLARIRELEALQGQHPQMPTSPVAEPPKFITQIVDLTKLVEGQSAHFEARLTPVTDPDLVVEWYYNGKKLPHGHRYRTFHDFGIVILDILYCYEENSGVYECRAHNKYGEDSTKATLKCVSKANLILDSQLPRGMEGGLEKIQTLEDSLIRQRDEKTTEEKGKAPVFTVPLSNIDSLREGENAHFEARLIPTDDPKLTVEWFWNNKPLRTGSRFRTFCDFGFVILEISPVYPEDSGEYSCRAFNEYGQAVTTATMKVQGKRSIIFESQLPKGMEGTIDKIAELEGLGAMPNQMPQEDDSGKPPEFITTPSDLTLSENALAHFECRLIPVNDPSMRVEWFHNGKALSAGSRIKTINDFGFVILEIAGCYQRESGLYTCKATNRHGEATVNCKLQVRGRQGIILEPQLPSNFRTGTESIQKLEESLYKREEVLSDDETPHPPKFTVELKDNADIPEGGPVHFDCRVEPVGDPSMRIDWFQNGRPFATGSRVHMVNDFGFISLDIDYIYGRDSGEYICRATNKWGSATTKATVTCKSKRNVDLESQLPSGMSAEKLKELERGSVSQAPSEDKPLSPPKFITQIQSHTVEENDSIRFECRVEPKEDPNLRIEWYRNGKLLPSGHRYRTVYDMGFVSLDILYVYAEDSGEYVCRAVNKLGEDFTKATVSCRKLPGIILQNQVPKGMKRSETLMQMEATIKKYTSEIHLTEEDLYDSEKKQPPRFVTQIVDQTTLVEMQSTKFECQLAPVGDPNMKVEWFFNGKPLPYKNRFTPIYDFGYVAMNFGWVYPEDSGEYLCRATNLYGQDETRAIIKTAGKPGIIYESQLPKGMKSIEKIREMEAAWQVAPEELDEDSKPRQAPVFVAKPEPVTVEESEWARFCCRVTGHPKPRVMWLINGHTIANGQRYKLTYDGMYHLDIPKTRQYDTGKIEVLARNSCGEAMAETTLKIIPRHDDYRGVLKNSPRRIIGTKEYRKPEWVTHMEELQAALKAAQSVPTFVQEIKDVRANEEEAVSFEGMFSGTPTPDVVWYKDDKLVRNTENVKIRIQDNKSTLTIKNVTIEDVATYTCKAVSEIGLAVTKAKLYVQELPQYEKKQIQLKKAKELEEKVKSEKVTLEKKKDDRKKSRGSVTFETRELDSVTVQEVQTTESTTIIEETLEQGVKAKSVIPILQPVETSATETCKKIETVEEGIGIKPAEKAEVTMTELQPISVQATVVVEDTYKELVEQEKPKVYQAKTEIIEQVEERATITEVQIREVIERVTKIIEKEEEQMAKQIEETLEFTKVQEFGEGESPLRELAEIGFLFQKGVTVDDVTLLYHADKFPALKTPNAQSAMVNVVERRGHGALIYEVLTEETTTDESIVAATVGFRAFMRMVEMKHATVEEVLINFAPEDFQTQPWISAEAHEVITQDKLSEKVEVTEQTELRTHVVREQKKIQTAQIIQGVVEEEAASLSITKEQEILEEEVQELQAGDKFFSICSYIAETDEAINLVEGERVYIMESHNSDWWFVKKNLTEEKGWVPAQYLMDEVSYTMYVQKKLHEKIDKLPVFEKPQPNEKAHAPRFIEKLQPKHIQDGYTIQFECKVEGSPRPQITWFRQTAIIKPSQDFQMYYDEDNVATLIIREVFPEDAGTFTCVAKNAAGFASSTTELNVEAPLSEHGSEGTGLSRRSLSRESSLADIIEGIIPTFSRKPNAQCVDEGEDVTFECRLAAIPEPSISWTHNSKKLTTKENITITTESDMHMYICILKITKVKKDQEGIYEIHAKNREGEATLTINLKVKTGDKEAPQILEPLKSVIVREDEVAIMSTYIVGNPKPKVEWFKNGEPAPKLPVTEKDNVYTFTLPNPKVSDTAEYTVKAKNTYGSAETMATLIIEDVSSHKPEPPIFLERFEEISVQEKGTIILYAKVAGNPVPEVQWLHNNEPLKPSDKVTMTYDGENIKLVIKNADSETDSGDYKCIAFNPLGRTSHGAKVTVEVENVKFTKKLKKSIEILERETLQLECETSHSVSTLWYHNNKEISGMDHREVIQEGRKHKLIIKSASINDLGTYKCVVRDQKTECSVTVKEGKTEFIRKLQDFEVIEKECAILEVEVSSETVDIEWRKDGKVIKKTDEKYTLEKQGTVRKLLIRSASIHDEGEYFCALPEEECSSEVTVIELPPEIIKKLQDQTIQEGEKAMFEIELTKGDALIRWFKDGKELQFSEHVQLSIDGKRQKLKIYNTTMEDAGVYSCVVGEQKSSASLTVTVGTGVPTTPTKHYEPPKLEIDETLINQTLETNRQWKVDARYRGYPKPEITWMRNGQTITTTERCVIKTENMTSTIMINSVESQDTGTYKVNATNKIGTDSRDLNLKVLGRPSPPLGPLDITGMTATSFTLKWQPSEYDGGSKILEYIVEMREDNTTRWKKVGASKGDITDIPISNLKKDTAYFFKIYARNDVGMSDAFMPEEKIVAGQRITPPSCPTNVRVTEFTSRSATIAWGPPVSTGGTELTDYILEKRLAGSPKWEKVVTLEPTVYQHTIENLKEKNEFVFRVFAENSVGLSTPAQTPVVALKMHATVPSPPTAPLEIRSIGPNAVVIEWGIPESDGGAPIECYNIAIRDIKKTMWMEVGRVPKGVQKFTLRDLQEDHDYLIRIFARNEVGLSDPLESDEPFKVLPSTEADMEETKETTDREPTSYSTETTTSWMREANMDADIYSYARSSLLRRDEYFFRIWCYAQQLFK